jgi:hypothetical protein
MIKLTHKKYSSISITGLGKFEDYYLKIPKESLGNGINPDILVGLLEREVIEIDEEGEKYLDKLLHGKPEVKQDKEPEPENIDIVSNSKVELKKEKELKVEPENESKVESKKEIKHKETKKERKERRDKRKKSK